MAITVGVKFCGNCNPDINSIALLDKLKEEAKEKANFVCHSFEKKDIVLIISGCQVDCAERPNFSGPVVIVASETVQLKHCPEKYLPRVVLEQILNSMPEVSSLS